MILEKISKVFLGFLVIMYVTRYLGPNNFGILAYFEGVLAIAVAISSLGLANGGPFMKQVLNPKEDISKVVGTSSIILVASSLISIFLIFALVFLEIIDPANSELILIMSSIILLQNLNMIFIDLFQSNARYKEVFTASIIAFLISSSFKVAFVFYELDIFYFALSFVLDNLFLTIFLYIKIIKLDIKISDLYFDKFFAIKILKTCTPLVIVAGSAILQSRIDQLMLKHLASNFELGNYSATMRVTDIAYMFIGIIATSLYSKLINTNDNQEKFSHLVIVLMRITFLVSFAIFLTFFFLGDFITSIIFGDEFSLAGELLSILAFGILINFPSAVYTKLLYVKNLEKKFMYIVISGFAINTLLNYILIPTYGANGAAYATITTFFIINFIVDLFSKDLRALYILKIRSLNIFHL